MGMGEMPKMCEKHPGNFLECPLCAQEREGTNSVESSSNEEQGIGIEKISNTELKKTTEKKIEELSNDFEKAIEYRNSLRGLTYTGTAENEKKGEIIKEAKEFLRGVGFKLEDYISEEIKLKTEKERMEMRMLNNNEGGVADKIKSAVGLNKSEQMSLYDKLTQLRIGDGNPLVALRMSAIEKDRESLLNKIKGDPDFLAGLRGKYGEDRSEMWLSWKVLEDPDNGPEFSKTTLEMENIISELRNMTDEEYKEKHGHTLTEAISENNKILSKFFSKDGQLTDEYINKVDALKRVLKPNDALYL